MTTIGYNDIENILLSLQDPNTGSVMTDVPGVSSPKINGGTSIYNVQADGGTGIAGWSTNVSWTATDYNTVSWGSGSIYLPDGTELTVTSGNTGNMSSTTYIYYDRSDNTVKYTTSANDSVGEDKILICVAAPTSSGKDAEFQAFGTNAQSTFIYADNIAANTITGNEIQSNTITSTQIQSHSITANELSVYELGAITANLGDVTVGNNNDSKIRIRPNGNQGRIDFSYEGTSVGSMIGTSVAGPGDTLGIIGGSNGSGNIALSGNVWCLGKLRIPVGTNLY